MLAAFHNACLTLSLSAYLQLEGLAIYKMPIRWIGDVLPKTMEQDAGRDYCYVRKKLI